MELRDFLNNADPRENGEAEYSKNINRNYMDELVSFFTSNPAVSKAYFGLIYNEEESREDLFLAVEHEGDLSAIKSITGRLKQKFLPAERKLFFTSTENQPELFNYVAQNNFPFYVQDKPQPLPVAVMKQWFNPEKYRKEFLYRVKTGRLSSLFKDFNPNSNMIYFQTYVRNGREFIPLFSDKEMIYKSGMTQVPPELTAIEFDWTRVNEMLNGKLSRNFYVLNPGTSFEVEFTAI